MPSETITFYTADDADLAQVPWLANDADVLTQGTALHQRPRLALHFPKWTDGRAYSQAVLLRGRVRYTGELVAVGDVLADMLPLLRRCGFNAVQMRADQQLATAQRALGFISTPYQQVLSERHAWARPAPP